MFCDKIILSVDDYFDKINNKRVEPDYELHNKDMVIIIIMIMSYELIEECNDKF